MPVFAYPLAALALLGVPALLAVYFLNVKYRPRQVSSLMLWQGSRHLESGGRRLQRFFSSLLFFLELLALLLLALAALDPRLRDKTQEYPAVFILDNSSSMSALDTAGGRRIVELAARQIAKLAAAEDYRPLAAIVAGPWPRPLPTNQAEELRAGRVPDAWTATDPAADIEAAIALAERLGGGRARLVVVSDRPAAAPPPDGSPLFWLAVAATDRANTGFIEALRHDSAAGVTVSVQIANFSDRPGRPAVRVEADGAAVTPAPAVPVIPPGGREWLNLRLPPDCGPVVLSLPPDALAADNLVRLLPVPPRRVRTRLACAEPQLRRLLETTLAATGLVDPSEGAPQLLVTDDPAAVAGSACRLVVRRPATARPYTGPFVGDFASELLDGAVFEGTHWTAAPDTPMPGAMVLAAGNVPLLTVVEGSAGLRELHLQIAPEISTVQRHAAWPVLFWNVLNRLGNDGPGFAATNVRVGETHPVRLDAGGAMTLTLPDGTAQELKGSPGSRRGINFAAAGLHALDSPAGTWQAAANFLEEKESDLRPTASGRWGASRALADERLTYASLAGWLLAGALALLCMHLLVLARAGAPLQSAATVAGGEK